MLDSLEEVGVLDGRDRHEIDVDLEQVSQPVQQTEVRVCVLTRREFLEFYEKIQIASRRIEVTASGRPEKLEATHPKSSAETLDISTVGLNNRSHFVNRRSRGILVLCLGQNFVAEVSTQEVRSAEIDLAAEDPR